MHWLAVLTSAWTAVYAYLAIYYGMLYRLREERAHATFALTCACLSVFAFGSVMAALSVDVASVARWQNVQIVGLVPASAFFVDFGHSFLGVRRGRLVLATYVWSFCGWIAAVAGFFSDPAFPGPTGVPRWGMRSYEPQTTFVGFVFVIGMIAWLGAVATILLPRARRQPDARAVLVAGGIFITAGLYDLVVLLLDAPTPYLTEHAGVIGTAFISWILIDRVARTGQELATRTAELERSHDALRQAEVELHRSDQLALVGELSAMIAHEVRAPLSVIKSASLDLRRPALEESAQNGLLDVLDEEANRLNRLVTDLLIYARPLAPQGRAVRLVDLVEEASDLVRHEYGRGEGILTRVDIPEDTAVQGDPDLLKRAFSHVIENAFQAMAAGGILSIASAPTRSEPDAPPAITVSFRDTGEGMDTLVRRRAGLPFFTTRPSGTGLGLAIVDRLVRAHGGSMQIDSRHGSGTTVSLTLPLELLSPDRNVYSGPQSG